MPPACRVYISFRRRSSKVVVAEDVDRTDLGEVALVNLEHHIDAVLVELDDLRFDAGREASLPAIELKDPVDIGADRRAGEDLARRELDLRRDLVVLEALVALQDDAVDDRVFADVDHQVAGVGAGDGDVGEQLGRVEVLQRLIERDGGVGLARRQVRISANRFRLEPLVALDRDRPDGRARPGPRGGRGGAAERRGGGSGGGAAWASTARRIRRGPFRPTAARRRALKLIELEITRPRLL